MFVSGKIKAVLMQSESLNKYIFKTDDKKIITITSIENLKSYKKYYFYLKKDNKDEYEILQILDLKSYDLKKEVFGFLKSNNIQNNDLITKVGYNRFDNGEILTNIDFEKFKKEPFYLISKVLTYNIEYSFNEKSLLENNNIKIKKEDVFNLIKISNNKDKVKMHLFYYIYQNIYNKTYIKINSLYSHFYKIPKNLINQSLQDLQKENLIYQNNDKISFKIIRVYEELIINKINSLKKEKVDFNDQILTKYNNLNREQRKAVINAFSSNFSLISGSPGTGKTYTINIICQIEKQLFNKDVILLAPTGKAARKLEQVTNLKAHTMHRFYNNYVLSKEISKLKNSLVIIDEASMISYDIFYLTLEWAVQNNMKLIMVGDINQLEPIGFGQIYEDLYNFYDCDKVELLEIYRQDSNSNLSLFINDIKNNHFNQDLINQQDIFFYEKNKDNIYEFASNLIKEHNFNENETAIITSRKNNSSFNANDANNYFHNQLKNKDLNRFYKKDESVIFIKNKYSEDSYYFNGDEGQIIDIINENNKQIIIVKNLINDQEIKINLENSFDNLEYNYAKTVHKVQGMEYKNIIFFIFSDQKPMINKKILYTAISRAKEKLIIVGEKKAINESLLNKYKNDKITTIKDIIMKG